MLSRDVINKVRLKNVLAQVFPAPIKVDDWAEVMHLCPDLPIQTI
jgi:hypothetical protein